MQKPTAEPADRSAAEATAAQHAAARLDAAVVERYLAEHVPGFRGPLEVQKTPPGQSNPTFILSSPSGRYVLRRKPPGQLLKSAHAVDRDLHHPDAVGSSRHRGCPVRAPVVVDGLAGALEDALLVLFAASLAVMALTLFLVLAHLSSADQLP